MPDWVSRPTVALAAGVVLGGVAALLLVSETSRAVAAWIAPLAAALVLAGLVARKTGRKLPRWFQAVVLAVAFVLLALGVWTAVVAALGENVTV